MVLDRARARIAELEEKLRDLQETLAELRQIEKQATDHLHTHANGPQSRDLGRHS